MLTLQQTSIYLIKRIGQIFLVEKASDIFPLAAYELMYSMSADVTLTANTARAAKSLN